MINWLLTAILAVLSVLTAIITIFLCKTAAIFRELVVFISPAGGNSPSPAALVWSAMAKEITQGFKMSLMGLMSVQSKAEKRAGQELVEAAVAEKSPLAGIALEAFPSLKKLLMRNSGLLDFVISKVATTGGKPGPGEDNHQTQGSFADRLGKY